MKREYTKFWDYIVTDRTTKKVVYEGRVVAKNAMLAQQIVFEHCLMLNKDLKLTEVPNA